MRAARHLAIVRPDAGANERKRRYRKRQKRDCAVAPVEYTNEVVSFLINLCWLDLSKSEDRREVGASISRMIADAARAHKP